MKRNLTGKGQEKTVAEWHQAKRSTMSRWKTVCIVVVHIWAKDSTLATARRGGIEQRRGESRWECMVAFGWLRQEESRRVRRPSRRGRGLDGWSAKPVDAFKAFSRGAGKFRCPILVSVFTFRALLSRFCQRLRREKKNKRTTAAVLHRDAPTAPSRSQKGRVPRNSSGFTLASSKRPNAFSKLPKSLRTQ